MKFPEQYVFLKRVRYAGCCVGVLWPWRRIGGMQRRLGWRWQLRRHKSQHKLFRERLNHRRRWELLNRFRGIALVLTSDAGVEMNVDVRDSTKIVRIAPGQKDLKDAQTIALTDLQVGDRILVRGKAGDDNKTFSATSIIAMKKADIAEKQSHERDEWQKSGVGGLVNNVDAASGIISITTPSLREKKTVAVHVTKDTVLRRYAPGSVKFDDAKPAPLGEIRPGDQLRARGEKNADGSELTAQEIVSGSFRNISGTISSLDSAQSTITVHDLATKKNVAVKITSESQLRKLPAPMAQRIAQRLNGSSGANGGQAGGQSSYQAGSAAPTASRNIWCVRRPRTRLPLGTRVSEILADADEAWDGSGRPWRRWRDGFAANDQPHAGIHNCGFTEGRRGDAGGHGSRAATR